MAIKIVWNARAGDHFIDHTGTRRDRFQWIGRAPDQRYEIASKPEGGYVLKHFVREATGDWGNRIGDYASIALAQKAAATHIRPVRETSAQHAGTGMITPCLRIGEQLYSDRGLMLSANWVRQPGIYFSYPLRTGVLLSIALLVLMGVVCVATLPR